jgi:hemoglobin-like flavoprotein
VTPDDLALLERTVTELHPRGDEVAADFYRRLFDRVPEARMLFTTDLVEQRQKFFATLTEIVTSLHDLTAVAEPTHELGARHRAYGVQPHHYGEVGQVLVDTMAAAMGERFTAAHRTAWTRGFDLVAELMQQGASPPPTKPRLGDRTRAPK